MVWYDLNNLVVLIYLWSVFEGEFIKLILLVKIVIVISIVDVYVYV